MSLNKIVINDRCQGIIEDIKKTVETTESGAWSDSRAHSIFGYLSFYVAGKCSPDLAKQVIDLYCERHKAYNEATDLGDVRLLIQNAYAVARSLAMNSNSLEMIIRTHVDSIISSSSWESNDELRNQIGNVLTEFNTYLNDDSIRITEPRDGGFAQSMSATEPMAEPLPTTNNQGVSKNKKGMSKWGILVIAILVLTIVIAGIGVATQKNLSNTASAPSTTDKTDEQSEEQAYIGAWTPIALTYDGVEMTPEEVGLDFTLLIYNNNTVVAFTNGEKDGSGSWQYDGSGIVITDGTGTEMYGVLDGDQLIVDFGDGFIATMVKQ